MGLPVGIQNQAAVRVEYRQGIGRAVEQGLIFGFRIFERGFGAVEVVQGHVNGERRLDDAMVVGIEPVAVQAAVQRIAQQQRQPDAPVAGPNPAAQAGGPVQGVPESGGCPIAVIGIAAVGNARRRQRQFPVRRQSVAVGGDEPVSPSLPFQQGGAVHAERPHQQIHQQFAQLADRGLPVGQPVKLFDDVGGDLAAPELLAEPAQLDLQQLQFALEQLALLLVVAGFGLPLDIGITIHGRSIREKMVDRDRRASRTTRITHPILILFRKAWFFCIPFQ